MIVTGKYIPWGIVETGKTREEVISKLQDCAGIILANEIKWKVYEDSEYILRDIPEEFHGALSYIAYEQGHSAGQDEVNLILSDLVYNLAPAIKKFEDKLIQKYN
jgi:hypothetical protein